MRRAVWPAAPVVDLEAGTAERLDRRRRERLVLRHRRQNAGQARREHRLAAAGRADHDKAVAARGGNLERALGVRLAFNVGEIGIVLVLRSGFVAAKGELIATAKVRAYIE